MLSDFIFSVDGMEFLQPFNEQFLCRFRYDEPDGGLVFDVGENTYGIPESDSVADFKDLISESIKANRNLLEDRYKMNIIEYDSGVDY